MKSLYLSVFLLIPYISYANNSEINSLKKLPSNFEKNMKHYVLNEKIESKGGYIISDSNIVFDCKGKVLDGHHKVPNGILIESYGENISNITIRNCTFQNFAFNGIRVGWGISGVLKQKIPSNKIYSYHPKNILIQNVKIINSGTVGLFINDHVQNLTLENSEITNSMGTAIYVDYSSRKNKIINNIFYHNGYKNNSPFREAIAVDGGSENIFKNNIFKSNGRGSIFLYKNCQENVSKGNSPIRIGGSDFNIIEGNFFESEEKGVWIASRQSLDLSKWDCGDKPIFEHKYYQDYASHNHVINNTFKKVKNAIIIEGDFNIIRNNKFLDISGDKIKVPVIPRAIYLNKPQIGNIIESD